MSARAQPAPQEGEPAEAAPQEGEPPAAAPPEAPPEAAPVAAPDDPEAGYVAPPPQGEPEAPAQDTTAPAAPDAAEEEPATEPEATPPDEGPAGITFAEPPSEEPAQEPADEPCDPATQSCECPKNWGCWDLIYSTKGTILGAKITVTYSDANAPEELDAGFVTFYSTEHYATRNNLTVHVLAFGGLGGGTANNEGSLGFGLDFGWRGAITETSGPFLRVGTGGFLTGHRAFYLSLFEPFLGRAGYQVLDGDNVFEIGMTHGFIPVGRFEPGRQVERDLSRTKELGGYVAFHRESYRADASFLHVFDAQAGDDRDDVEIARAVYCDYRLGFALCADGLFTRGEAVKAGKERMTNALYFGITLGLTP